MRCKLCHSSQNIVLLGLYKHDKYQKLINVEGERAWWKCMNCEAIWQHNNLTEQRLQNIYLKYRDLSMRDKTIRQRFEVIMAMPDSENNQRVNQLVADKVLNKEQNVLDIGSGLGVFPYMLQPYVKKVNCIEPNPESALFMNEKLGIDCYEGFYEPGIYSRNDLVTCVHVLEHMQDPLQFLGAIHDVDLKEDGTLFIEVPDACEFDYLPEDHDEFNSCHTWFFNVSTLDRVLRQAGFKPYLMRRIKYKGRDLSRITALCHCL